MIAPLLWVILTAGAFAATVDDIELTVNPCGNAPLVARCETRTAMTLRLTGPAESFSFHASESPVDAHVIDLIGLKPDTLYRMDFSRENTRTFAASPIVLRTAALPEWFPPIRCTVSRPERMEPGVTLMVIYRWIDQALDRDFGLLVAVDERGEVVWHYRPHHAIHAVSLLENGRLKYISDREGTLYEIDFMGDVHQRWHTTGIPKAAPLMPSVPVETDTFHHDVIELPSGRLLTLSTEIRPLADYPSSEHDPNAPKETANVVGDVIVEMTRDGTIVREHRLLDILDPYRIGYDSLTTFFWQRIYAARESWSRSEEFPRDWSHANALFYDAAHDAILVSLYHLDAVISLDRRSGELRWILGTPDGWREPWRAKCLTPEGELAWPYHQHAVSLTASGHLLLFDNGKFRARPFERPAPFEESSSRVVEYEIDEARMTVREVWSYQGDSSFFSSFLGDVREMPETGNVLITDGGEVALPDGTHAPMGFGKNWAQLMEISREGNEDVVFALELKDDRPQVGWSVYRSIRIPWGVFAPQRVVER